MAAISNQHSSGHWNINHYLRSFDLVFADELYFLDLFNRAVGVVECDLAVAFPHTHLDADAEVVRLARAHVYRVTLLVVSQTRCRSGRASLFDSRICDVVFGNQDHLRSFRFGLKRIHQSKTEVRLAK